MNTIAQLTPIISTAIALVALFSIWIQLRIQNKQLKAQHKQIIFESLTQLHQELLIPSMQRALRFIHNSKSSDLVTPKSEDDLEKLELVLNTFDLIGFRVRKGFLPEEETLSTEWMTLIPIWQKVKPFIDSQRERRGNIPYKQHIEWLYEKTENFRKQYDYKVPESFGWGFGENSHTQRCEGSPA